MNINNALYLTLKEMNLAIETADFPHPSQPDMRLYVVEVKYKLIPLLRSKKIDLKNSRHPFAYHVWRRKGSDGKLELVDHIFNKRLSRKTVMAKKRLKEPYGKKEIQCPF